MLLDTAKIDVAGLALHGVDRLQWLLPEPRRDHLHVGPILERHLQHRRDRFLHRDLDMLPLAIVKVRERRRHRRRRAMHAARVAGLMPRSFEWRQLRMLRAAAIQHAHPARAPDTQVLCATVAILTAKTYTP